MSRYFSFSRASLEYAVPSTLSCKKCVIVFEMLDELLSFHLKPAFNFS